VDFGIYVRKNTTNNAKKQLFGSLKCRKRQLTLLSSYSLLLHFHTPRLDFHNPNVYFHTIQLSALHYIRQRRLHLYIFITLDTSAVDNANSEILAALGGWQAILLQTKSV